MATQSTTQGSTKSKPTYADLVSPLVGVQKMGLAGQLETGAKTRQSSTKNG